MYTLHAITKQYRTSSSTVTALDGIDLEVANGEFLAIQGRTGSGKTTLLQILGAMDRPTSGQVRLAGQDLGALSAHELTELRAASIAFVFQAFNLIPTLTAVENVESALVPLASLGPGRWATAADALAAVGLADRAHHLPSQLSGGQQQRVAIARALVNHPSILLADEPTGNLDSRTSVELMSVIQGLNDQGAQSGWHL